MRSTALRISAALALFLLAQAGLAAAAPDLSLELDRSFGGQGKVDVELGVPGEGESFPEALVGTRTGGFFSLESTSPSGCRHCSGWYLVRYSQGGKRDRSFGFVPVAQGLSIYAYAELSVDFAGRPLVVWKDGPDAIIRRFTPRGSTRHHVREGRPLPLPLRLLSGFAASSPRREGSPGERP